MAKQKGYESVMGSVFDFIFNESKKDPGKVKPLKVTGVDSSSKLSDAMVSALEKPLLFVNDTTMGAFEDMMSSDLLAIRYGKGERDNVKITTKDLGNALKNPSGFLDKAFEKIEANQKVNMASWAGDSIRAVLAGTWARKHNLDVETQMAMAVMHNAQDRTKQTTNFSPVPVAEMGERTGKLLEKYLGENSTLTDADILKRFGREDATTKKAKIEKWKKDYQEGGRKNLLYSKEVYAFVEGQELMEKSKEARENNDKEKAKNYYRASRYLDALQGEDEYKNFKRRSLRQIKSYKDAIVKLKVGTDPQKDVKIREIENQIKMLNGQIASGRLYQLAGNIGRFQGMYGSMKGVHEYTVGGSLAGALITGDFFDPNKNKTWLCPTDATAKKTLKDSSVAGFSKLGESGGGVGFRIAAKTGNKFIDGYNEQMIRFYYSSPIVGIKSLATGEVFARRAYEEMNKFNRRFGQKIPGFDMKELFDKDGNVVDGYLGQIMGVASEDQKEALAKFLKSNERWNKMALRFSAIKRRQDAIGGYFDAKIGKNLRKSFASFLLKNRAFSNASKEILGEWIEKGGIQVLAKAFGVTVSGLAGPLAPIVSKLVSDVAVKVGMAVAKPILKFSLQWVMFTFFGILGFVILMTMNNANVLGVNSGESPRDVVACKQLLLDNSDGVGIFDPINSNLESLLQGLPIFDGDIQEIFNAVLGYVSGEYRPVSIGLELVNCDPSKGAVHRMCASISWAWCYSADKIYCKHDKLKAQSGGVLTNLFIHEVIHLLQRGGGGGGSVEMTEWGADYLSNNGGGYSFAFNGTCARATQIASHFIANGCSGSDLRSVALNEKSGVSSSCGQLVRSTLKFCERK